MLLYNRHRKIVLVRTV